MFSLDLPLPVALAVIGLYALLPRVIIQLHAFLWLRGGRPSEFGVGIL